MFVVILSGSGESRARQAALALQQHVSEEAGSPDNLPLTAAVGWVFAETGDEDSVLDAAMRALKRAKACLKGSPGYPRERRTPNDSSKAKLESWGAPGRL